MVGTGKKKWLLSIAKTLNVRDQTFPFPRLLVQLRTHKSTNTRPDMKKITAAVLLSLVSTAATALDVFGGVEGGYAFVDINADTTAQTLANLSGRTTTYTYDRAALTGRVFGGVKISQSLSAEIGYFTSMSLDATYTNSLGTANESYRTGGFDVSATYRPEPKGLFIRAGIHRSEVTGNANVSIGGYSASASASQSGVGFLAGAGYSFALSDDLEWFVAATHYNKLGGMSGTNANLVSAGVIKNIR